MWCDVIESSHVVCLYQVGAGEARLEVHFMLAGLPTRRRGWLTPQAQKWAADGVVWKWSDRVIRAIVGDTHRAELVPLSVQWSRSIEKRIGHYCQFLVCVSGFVGQGSVSGVTSSFHSFFSLHCTYVQDSTCIPWASSREKQRVGWSIKASAPSPSFKKVSTFHSSSWWLS